MSVIPNLDNLIKAIECEEWKPSICEYCQYNYQYLDDSGDHAFWFCDEEKKINDALFYLKLYQHLIKEQENGK